MEGRVNYSVATKPDRTSDLLPGAIDLSFEELLRKLRRRKWLIVAIIALGTILTGIVTLLLPHQYTAAAQVLVSGNQEGGIDLEAITRGTPPDLAYMSSQVQVVSSRNLAAAVIDKLNLDADPDFNGALQPKSWLDQVMDSQTARQVRALLGLEPPAIDEALARRLERERVIDAFLANLDAEIVETSRVINISFTTLGPAKAAQVANAIADAYINQQLETQYDSFRRTMSWLTDRVAVLRNEVKTADNAVEKFRAERGLLRGARGEALNEQQISELSSQLVLARSHRAESEARLAQVRNLSRSGEGVASVAEVVNSPLITSLISQETEVKRKIAQYVQEYGERHPVLINAKAELQDLQSKIKSEVNRVVQTLQNEVFVAGAREQSLQRSLDQFGARLTKSNADEITLRALERDADAARLALETFLQQSQQLNSKDQLRAQQPNVSLISYAPVPLEASFPKRKLLIALAMVVSALIAVVVVLIVEQLDAGFRSAEQIEQAFGVAVLGSVPELKRRRRGSRHSIARFVLQQPTSAFAEAVRRAHTKVLQERAVRTVMFTSAEPGEGKSTLAVNLVQTDARLGRRVLLIDADFRRSEVADLLELNKSPGLVDVLNGRVGVDDAIQVDRSGAHVIVAGDFEPSTSQLLILRNLEGILGTLRDRYDLIIVDAPPVISLVDAAVVAGQVDRTILVVRWAGTRRSVVGHALSEVLAAGGTLCGVILSMVNVKRHALYGFGDSGQYHGRYKKYYDVG